MVIGSLYECSNLLRRFELEAHSTQPDNIRIICVNQFRDNVLNFVSFQDKVCNVDLMMRIDIPRN